MQRDQRVKGTAPRAFDAAAIRQYFAGLEALAREARASNDPRVLLAALSIVERQHATVVELFRGKA